MPPVVAWVAATWASWGAALGFTTKAGIAAWATIGKAIVYTAASYGVNRLLASSPGRGATTSGLNQTIRTPDAPWEIIYGETRKGGSLHYARAHGDDNEYLTFIIVLADHESEAISEIYFDDNLAVNAAGTVQSPYSGLVQHKKVLGDQTAVDASIQGWVGVDKWTATDIIKQKTFLGLRLTWDEEVFAAGIPNITAIVKGRKVLDTRTSTTAWSNNPALCLRDYLTDKDVGLGEESDNIDDTLVDTAANVCEESVTLADAETENKYECNGVIPVNGSPGSAIEEIVRSMAGSMIESGGIYKMYAGKWREPEHVFGENDLIGDGINVRTAISARERFNAVKGIYISPENDHQVADYPTLASNVFACQDGLDTGSPITSGSLVVGSGYRIVSVNGGADFTGVGADSNTVGLVFVATGTSPTWGTGGELQEKEKFRIFHDLELPFTQSPSMCQRVAKIVLLESRQEQVIEASFKLGALRAVAGDNIRFFNRRMGLSEATGTTGTASSVDATTNVITMGTDPFVTGDIVQISSTGNVPAGLTVDTYYYAIRTEANKIAFARAKEAADNGQRIDITDTGSGTITIEKHIGKAYRVISWGLSQGSGGTPGVAISMVLRETASESFDWATSEEQQVDPAPGSVLPSAIDVPTPTSFAVDSGSSVLYIREDGSIAVKAKLTWDVAPSAYVTKGGHVIIQRKQTGEWENVRELPGSTTQWYDTDVNQCDDYSWRIRFETILKKPGDWSTAIVDHTIVGKDGAPTPSVIDGGESGRIGSTGDARIAVNITSDLDHGVTRLLRKRTDETEWVLLEEFIGRDVVGETVEYQDLNLRAGKTYHYTTDTYDTTGNKNATPSIMIEVQIEIYYAPGSSEEGESEVTRIDIHSTSCPFLDFWRTDAPTDSGRWHGCVDSTNGDFRLQAVNDAETAINDGFLFQRDGSLLLTGFLELPEISEPDSPTDAGRIFGIAQNGKYRLKLKNSDGIVRDIVRDSDTVVRNTSGGTLTKGTPVYVSDQTGQVPNVSPAKSDAQATMPAVGILMEDAADNAYVLAIQIGILEDIDTSAFSVGDPLYVSAATAGELTATRPAHPHLNQEVARVLVSGVGNGALQVTTVNDYLGDELGTRENTYKIGDGTAGTKTFTFAADEDGSIKWDGSNLILDPNSGSVLPDANYDVSLGSSAKKYLSLHAAELIVETLVAQDTIGTIGGRVLVGPTTILTRDITDSGTTIYVRHNQISNGDVIYLEAAGNVEFMAVTSAATEITAGEEYSYTVTRNLDSSGANAWFAGDAALNTGATGDGFIDLYSTSGVFSGTGPAIVGNVRGSSTFNDWTEHWAIGNLNGLYGYGADTYGVGIGEYGADHITVDSTNGIRFRDSADTVHALFSGAEFIMGEVAASKSNVRIDSGSVQLRTNATVNAELTTAGLLRLGTSGASRTEIDSSGIDLYGGSTQRGHIDSDGSGWFGTSTALSWDAFGNLTLQGSLTSGSVLVGSGIGTTSINFDHGSGNGLDEFRFGQVDHSSTADKFSSITMRETSSVGPGGNTVELIIGDPHGDPHEASSLGISIWGSAGSVPGDAGIKMVQSNLSFSNGGGITSSLLVSGGNLTVSGGFINLSSATRASTIQTTSSQALKFGTGITEAMRILTDQRVAINRTTASFPLDVQGTIRANSTVRIDSSVSTADPIVALVNDVGRECRVYTGKSGGAWEGNLVLQSSFADGGRNIIVNLPSGQTFRVGGAGLMNLGNRLGIGRDPHGTHSLDVNSSSLFRGTVNLNDATNMAFGTSTGTKIGTASSQKIGLWGVTPVTRPAAPSYALGTSAAEVADVLNNLMTRIKTTGLLS